MKFLNRLCAITVLVLGAAGLAAADIKVTTKTTTSGTSFEGTTYIKGARQRTEQKMMSFESTDITQCDLKRYIKLNDKARKYLIDPMEDASSAQTAKSTTPAQQTPPTDQRKVGVVTYVTTINDTGERKQMFGFTARHLKTSMTVESSPDACSPTSMKTETDGWYIDLQFGLDCQTANMTMRQPRRQNSGCRDQIRQRTVGGGKLGFPAMVTTTMHMGGDQTFTSTQEIVALSMSPLDAALFDIPAGYTEAKDDEELTGAMSAASMMKDALEKGSSGDVASASTTAGRVAAKSPDAIRIGVIAVNNRTDRPLSDRALRDRLINFINESGIDAITLAGGTPAEVSAEAKAKQCDYLLYTDVTNVKQSTANKIGGLLGRVSSVPGVGGKYEARVEFRLLSTSDLSPVLQTTASVKEEGGEEGTVSAALEKEAKMIAAEVKKRK